MPYFFCISRKSACWCLYLLPVFFLFSCANKQDAEITDKYSELYINNKSVKDTVDVSKMVDSVKVLKLTDALHKSLSRIDQLYTLGDYYIAIDAVHTKRVNAYDANGNYVKTLIEDGPAKTDALNVTDCYVNEKNEVIIYDYAQMKLFVFDANLASKKSIKSGILFNYNHIASLPGTDNFVGYSSYYGYNAHLQNEDNSPSCLDIMGNDLSLVKKHLIYPPKFNDITLITLPKSFFPFKDSLRFFRAFDSYIYSLNKNEIERRYKILYAEGNFPPDFLGEIINPHLNDFQNIGRNLSSFQALHLYFKGYTCPASWLETDNIIYLSSITFSEKKTNNINSVILKKGKTPEVITAKVFAENSRFKLAFPNFNTYDKKKNEFITYCSGNKLKKYLYKDSPLIRPADIVDDSFYLIKVKFKRKQ